jgi:hypothetical protein
LTSLGDDPVFRLQPHLRLLDLAYPVDSMLLDVRHSTDRDLDIASNVFTERRAEAVVPAVKLPAREPVFLAVHRQDYTVYFKRLKGDAFTLLAHLQQGEPLSAAIEVAVGSRKRDVRLIGDRIHNWFADWASLGWFCREG